MVLSWQHHGTLPGPGALPELGTVLVLPSHHYNVISDIVPLELPGIHYAAGPWRMALTRRRRRGPCDGIRCDGRHATRGLDNFIRRDARHGAATCAAGPRTRRVHELELRSYHIARRRLRQDKKTQAVS